MRFKRERVTVCLFIFKHIVCLSVSGKRFTSKNTKLNFRCEERGGFGPKPEFDVSWGAQYLKGAAQTGMQTQTCLFPISQEWCVSLHGFHCWPFQWEAAARGRLLCVKLQSKNANFAKIYAQPLVFFLSTLKTETFIQTVVVFMTESFMADYKEATTRRPGYSCVVTHLFRLVPFHKRVQMGVRCG